MGRWCLLVCVWVGFNSAVLVVLDLLTFIAVVAGALCWWVYVGVVCGCGLDCCLD